jgi:hypothetical protein
LFLFLILIETAEGPAARMIHDPCSHGIELDIDKTVQEMRARFNRCGSITISPKGTGPSLSLIVFLSYTAFDERN